MASEINDIIVEKSVLDGTENFEIQEAAGGVGSSKRTKSQHIGEFALANLPHYGQREITQNVTSIAFTAAVDPTLSTNTDYIQITGIFDPPPDGENHGVTQQTNSITIGKAGVYNIEVWLSATSSTNSTAMAVKFAVNGSISLGRRPKLFVRNAGEVHSLSAFGYHHFDAGDVITLYMASDKTANITIQDAVFGVKAIKYD